MRKTTAFSIAVLTLSTAALAQVGTTPGDQVTGNNTTMPDNTSASVNSMSNTGSDTTAPTDTMSTPDETMTNTPDGN